MKRHQGFNESWVYFSRDKPRYAALTVRRAPKIDQVVLARGRDTAPLPGENRSARRSVADLIFTSDVRQLSTHCSHLPQQKRTFDWSRH